MNWVVAAQKEL